MVELFPPSAWLGWIVDTTVSCNLWLSETDFIFNCNVAFSLANLVLEDSTTVAFSLTPLLSPGEEINIMKALVLFDDTLKHS